MRVTTVLVTLLASTVSAKTVWRCTCINGNGNAPTAQLCGPNSGHMEGSECITTERGKYERACTKKGWSKSCSILRNE